MLLSVLIGWICIFHGFTFCTTKSTLLDVKWEAWKRTFGKHYSREEDKHRKETWTENMKYVNGHNLDSSQKYKLKLNEFSDMQPSEIGMFKQVVKQEYKNIDFPKPEPPLPAEWDWRKEGAITAVRNQGQAGYVAPIVVTEEVESYHFFVSGVLQKLSVEEVAECCTTGILSMQTYACVVNIGGLCRETDYHRDAGKCGNNTCTAVGVIHKGVAVQTGREDILKYWVAKTPVAAAVDASQQSFELYAGGIYDDPKCTQTQLDHAVQIVGYGTQNGTDFWILKNSWGTSWGIDGYMLMRRNNNNQCGIATAATFVM